MAELQIPIKVYIENLQSLIGDLQSKLSNLKVGSAGFKSLQNLINSMKNELDKLQIQGSKPFVDANQFVKAERSIDKLEDQLQKAEMTLGRLKFSDLELSPNQKADLQAFEDQINSIKTNLKSVKDTAKQDFLGSSLGQIWQSQFDSTAITKSFSQITNNIRAEVNKQIAIVSSAEQAMNDYQNAIKGNNSIDNFLKNKNPLDESSLGVERYAQIFQETARGLRFRSGGKTILEEWLKSQLQLDDATIKSLVEGSASKVKAELENRLKAIQISNKDIINNNAGSVTNYDTQKAKLEQLNSIMQQLGASEQMVNTVEQALRQQLTGTSRAMQEYQDNAVNAARGNMEFQSTSNQMRTQLESLRSTLQQSNAQFIQLQRTQQAFNQMKTAVVNFMGFNQVLNLTKNAIRNAINHIQELDSVMNKISIVTDMSTGDLWNQVDAYSKMAQSYGVSIKGAYEVSQIYYQQGLQTADVLTLTNETLKLAKISGLDYATTTDYMTTALRGFKMEMTDASTVVDVYSNLAAHTAVSQEELAVAMSKTASSMESVGATFEEASAMIGTMVAVTRESATNIGSAMKSIASRYGELTKDPTKLVDSEGEAMAFNKVDTALQSVGISMKTVDGQFREFTDVIIELGEKWDQLDSTQQRYIATQFAGNRQQSRFLALVSNVDLLKSNLDVAMNSEDIGTLQALKALDSIEVKTEQVRVAYQQFYTTIGAENVWKGFLDGAKNVINTLNSFPKLFGKLPIAAIAAVASIVNVIKTVGIKAITGFAETFGNTLFKGFASAQEGAAQGAEGIFDSFINTLKSKIGIAETTGQEIGQAVTRGMNTTTGQQQQMSPDKIAYDKNLQTITSFQKNVSGFAVTDPSDLNNSYQNLAFNMQRTGQLSSEVWQDIQSHPENAQQILEQYISKLQDTNQKLLETGRVASISGNKLTNIFSSAKFGKGLQSFGSALNMISMMIDTSQPGMKTLSGSIMSIGGAASLAGIGIQAMNGALKSIPWMAIASGVFAIINGLSTLIITPEEKLEELTTVAEELSNKAKESKAEYRNLDNSVKKLDELKEKRYESAEAAEEYQTAVDELAEKFPQMISGFDDAGNIIIDTTNAENVLAEARKKSADAAAEAAKAEYEKIREEVRQKKEKLTTGYQEGSDAEGIQRWIWNAERSERFGEISPLPSAVKTALQNLSPYIAESGLDDKKDIDSKEGQEALKALGEVLYNADIEKQFTDPEDLNLIKEAYSKMVQGNSDYKELMNISEAYAKQIVSAWMLSQDANSHVQTFLYNSTGALAMVTDAITNDIISGGFEVNDENARIMDSRGNYRTIMNNFISSLSAERLELFNKMYDASNIYSAEDFKTEFEGELNWDAAVYNIIKGYYDESQAAITQRLENSLKQERTFVDKNGVEYQKSTNDFYTQYADAILTATSQIQEQLLNEILSQYHNLASEGFIDQAQDNGLKALAVFSKIKEIESIDPQVYGSLVSSISDFNLNTKEGIDEFIDYIDSTDTKVDDGLKQSLEDLKETLFSNVSLTIQSITDEVVNNWSDSSKILSKLTSGLDLSDVNSVITQAKQYDLKDSFGNATTIDFQDFQSNEGKLVLTAEKANAYWDAFFSSQKNKIANVKTDLDNAMKQLTGSDNLESLEGIKLSEVSTEINNETAELFKTILGPDFSKYFEAIIDPITKLATGNFKVLENTELPLDQAVIQAYENNRDLISQYYQYIAWQRAEIETSYARSQGIYKLGDTVLSSEELSTIAKSLDRGGKKLDKNAFTERAIKNQINSVYDTLISDVLSKGFENINLADYKGLIANTDINLSGKYEDFVNNYVDFTGKTIDEINDLILEAREKDREKVSEDLIKDVTFISDKQAWADEKSLGQLANAFDIPLQNLLQSGAVVWNDTLKQYAIDIEKLKEQGIALDEVDNFALAVQESIEGLFKSLISQIKNAFGGTLDLKGQKELFDTLEILGIKDLDLQFTKTAEGLQLAELSAISLYNKLKQIDKLQASLVFDELRESLEKTNENFKTTGSLMAHITKIRDGTYAADKKISDARKKQYEAELAVAEEILAVRSTTEDESFKFMDQKIPAGQNNPLNYWEGWQKAFDAINTAKKTKRMDYSSFYNLITEMGNLSDLMGGKGIQIGKELYVTSQNVAQLIEDAAGNLETTSKDKSLKINLPKIDVDFNSAENMVKDIDAGIDAMAEQQIHMLDGLIALLETIVAMEKLGDIAGGGEDDTKIDLGDIFPKIEWDADGNAKNLEAITEYDDEYEQFLSWITEQRSKNKDLDKALNELKVNGMSLSDIFGLSAHDLAAKGKEFNEAYVAFLEGMRKAALSGDYDVDNIMASVKEVLAESGINDLTIDTGKSTMIIKGGVITTIEWEDPDTQAVLAEIDKDTEKAKEKLVAAMESYLEGEGTGDEGVTLEHILKVRHHIKVDEEKGEYIEVNTPDGNKVYKNDGNPKHWAAAQAEKQLEDLGLDSHKLTEVEYEDGYAETTTTIGTKDNIQVHSEGGEVIYTGKIGDLGQIVGSNPEEFKANVIKAWREREDKAGVQKSQYTDEMILYQNLGIRAKVAASITDDKGKPVDVSKDPTLRQGMIDLANNVDTLWNQQKFKKGSDGNYTYDIGGITYTFDGADIETNGKFDGAKAAESILGATGLDLALGRTITQGITDAFQELKLDELKVEVSKLSISTENPEAELADAEAAKATIPVLEATVQNLTITAADSITVGDSFTITNGDLKSIDAENAVAQLSKLGINSVQSLYAYTEGMTLPEGEQNFGTITATNVVAILSALAINKVNSLINNATMPEAQDWGSIVADVSATLSSLNITGVDNFKLSIAAMLQTAGKQLTIPVASAIVSQLNILNTTGALKSNETFTVTDITNAEGEASTLTITKITGDKTVTDLSNIKAGSNISAHAEGEATVTADSYRLDWTTVNAETGEITVQSITVPADLKFGDADSLQAYLDTHPGSVEVSTQLNDTIQEQLNQKTYTVSITPQYDPENPYTESYDENGNKTVKFNYQSIDQSIPENAIAPDNVMEVGGDYKLTPDNIDNSELNTKMQESGEESGEYVGEGVIDGMESQESNVETGGTLLGDAGIKGVKTGSGVASPSKYGIEIGEFVGEGLVQGLETSQPKVEAAAEKLGQAVIDKIKEAVTKISESIDKIIKAIDKIEEIELDELDTKNLEKLSTTLETISKNLQALVTSGNWALLSSALTLVNTFLTSIDEHTDVFETIAASINTFPIDALNAIKNTLMEMADALEKIDAKKQIQIDIQADGLDTVLSKLQEIAAILEKLTGKDFGLEGEGGSEGEGNVSTPTATPSGEQPITETKGVITSTDTSQVDGQTTINDASANVTTAEDAGAGEKLKLEGSSTTVTEAIDGGAGSTLTVEGASAEVNSVDTPDDATLPVKTELDSSAVDSYNPPPKTSTATYDVLQNGDAPGPVGPFDVYYRIHKSGSVPMTQATGNIGLAKAAGTPTLMGELGPELVVQDGHYFIAGQNGAEMVGLGKDAIVFNHLQTEQLLKNGMSSGRGRAVTNERNAVAFATGNINGGPAMASASAALAALKQLRAMWQSLQKAKISDLAGAGGGGGGGGGSGNEDKAVDPKEWVGLVERWYNLTQKIAQAEKEITHEEQLRAKLQSDFSKNGKAYYQSQKRSLSALKEQIQAQEQLNLSREDYYDKRLEALRTSALGQLIDFDSNGQMLFRKDLDPSKFDGFTDAMEWRTWLTGYDEDHKARFSSKEKYEKLKAAGLVPDHVYDSNGKEITMDSDQNGEITDQEREDYYYNISKQVFDNMDEYQEAQQSLHDSIEDGKTEVLKLQEEENQILQAMRDNQKEVEESVLEAIEDMKQREIDALEDERDKLEESVGKYIDGLNDALDREREMYDTQESQNELDTQKRRLAILQRSGGSAADISSLQSEIQANERDLYFDAQQAQINAIQEASDLEIERLDSQIALMQETLDYQKEYGLLWYNVYDVMQGSAEEIANFIMNGNSNFWKLSPLGTATQANDNLFQADQWVGYREDIQTANDSLVTIATASQREIMDKDYAIFDESMKKEFGNDYDKSGKYKDLFYSEYKDGEHKGDMTEVSSTVRSTYSYDAKVAQRKKEAGNYWTHTGPDRYIDIDDNQHWHYKYKEETIEGIKGWYFSSKEKENHNWGSDNKCTKCGHQKPAPAAAASGGWSPDNCADKCSGICKGQLWNDTSRSGGCFTAGTQIYMADGSLKNIEDVKIGEMVLAYDEQNKIFIPRRVYDTILYIGTEIILNIELINGAKLEITPGHPILTLNGWKSRDRDMALYEHEILTEWLYEDDIIIGYLQNFEIKSIITQNISRGTPVYNLTIEDCHTFIANGAVVHNAFAADSGVAGVSTPHIMRRVSRKAAGGYVKHGIYELGEQGTETVLTAQQTQVLRNNILSNRPSSLISLLKTYNEGFSRMSTPLTGTTTEDNSTNIDKLEFSMNVQQISNDYDARRAGEQAMNEIMRIARKTSAANSIRR